MSSEKSARNIDTGQDLMSLIENGDKDLFTAFYSDNFRKLILVSDKYVNSTFVAEEIVQNVFLKIWEDISILPSIKSIKAYLYRSVVNGSINYLNRERSIEKHHLKIAESFTSTDIEQLDEQNELIVLLYDEIDRLPEKCQRVFKLSRLEGLKYREIAMQLNISEKTVENHMGHALKTLRTQVLLKASHQGDPKGFKYFSMLSLFLY
jgi:RNA polymerase sigma-70 factor (ECF subfamily)